MNKKLMNEFSSWLKKHRAESGLTLLQVKTAIGDLCSDAYLSKLENDRYKGKKGRPPRPDIAIVEALACVFNRPLDEARTAAGYPPKNIIPVELQEFEFSKFSKELLRDVADYIRFKNSQNLTKINNFSDDEESNIYKTEEPILGELGDRRREPVESPTEEKNGK